MITYRGIVKGNIIQLEEPLPYPEGQAVNIAVEPLAEPLRPGSPAAIVEVAKRGPHPTREDVDALLRAINESKLPPSEGIQFDA